MSSRRLAAAAGLAALAIAAGGLAGRGARTLPPTPPDLLVVVLDACRADAIDAFGAGAAFGAAGGRPEIAPAIDALAAAPDSVVYLRHHVAGTWTKPSTGSLFTGRYPTEHGAWRPLERAPGGSAPVRSSALAARLPTLAERLAAAGYFTFAAVKSHHLARELGFARGFADYAGPDELAGDDAILARVEARLASAPRPFFGYVHFDACHFPYSSAERDADFMAATADGYDEAARRRAGIDFGRAAIRDEIAAGGARPEAADVAFLHRVYAAKLRRVDARYVAPLLAALRARGRFDSTLVAVTADHGEELLEHGGFGHGHALAEEILHVPLILKFPRGRRPPLPRAVDSATSAVDLLPTLLAAAGLAAPPGLPGTDLARPLDDRAVFAELPPSDWAVVSRDGKVVTRQGRLLAFDLAADPGERASDEAAAFAAATRGAALAEIGRRTRAALVAAPPRSADLPLDATGEAELRALGYLH